MFSIENDFLRVEFKALGAEMCRLMDKGTMEERLWNGDPTYWGKQAPVLFPFVGSSKNGQYTFGPETYLMGRHGFARNMDFEVTAHKANAIVFQLRANEVTRAIYPFDFVFDIAYVLEDHELTTTYTVYNGGLSDMIFSVGGHPAFRADYLNGVCSLEFEKPEKLETIKINLETGLLKGQKEPVALVDRKLLLTEAVFQEDALIFEGLKSNWVKLVDDNYQKSLKVSIDGFPSLGIWSPIAPFVCIEPWQGTADYEATSGRLEEKIGAVTLKSEETFMASFVITLEG